MGDSLSMSGSNKNSELPMITSSKNATNNCLVASAPKIFPHKTLKHMISLKHAKLGRGSTDQIVFFMLKVAILDMVRRVSRVRCPIVWRGLQALQVLSYPPFKWMQRWGALKNLVAGMQKLSRPLLFLSITTVFSNQSEHYEETTNSMDDSQPYSEALARQSIPDIRICDEASGDVVSKNWLLQLHKELEKQDITLPERINEDELHRFYTAANGDFTSLLSSIKRTIHWRETYSFLSMQELEMWSHLVFWHGYDVKLRPCLVMRLGLACSSLASQDRTRFVQALVSQIEHGVLHLVNVEDPRITVLMDFKGVSPFRFPMKILRSCSALVHDHYPNRLGSLFIIRLSPVARVIAQTFIQVLKPTTRQKLHVEGETYQKVLSECLQSIPLFLGGQCKCDKCVLLHVGNTQDETETNKNEANGIFTNNDLATDVYLNDHPFDGSCYRILRTAIFGILILWILIAFISGLYDPEDLSFLAS
eukprot:TRINITY_DN5761_c0_g1_i1.p1 TRINITY_DN5761_c0_g1~~TRINITY_DN5761_c0_g1_i1.p1  ORF type:complete len:477 (-),score=53.72 TRINITY_DN5761_c0_g1_i1:77-1507(-)